MNLIMIPDKIKKIILVSYYEVPLTAEVADRVFGNNQFNVTTIGNKKSKTNTCWKHYDIASLTRPQNSTYFKDILNSEHYLDSNIKEIYPEAFLFYSRIAARLFFPPLSANSLEDQFQIDLLVASNLLSGFDCNDHIFFRDTPHHTFLVALFFYAKKKSINISIMRRTTLNQEIVFFDDFREYQTNLFSFEVREGSQERINNLLLKIEADGFSKRRSDRLRDGKEAAGPRHKFRHFLWDLIRLILTGKFKRNEFYQLSRFTAIYEVLKAKTKAIYLKNYVRKRLINADLNRNYVYIALHYQPERSTDPEADMFARQISLIRFVKSALPVGWVIYVKEHPAQFYRSMNFPEYYFRSTKFYNDIGSINDVFLVNASMNSEELVKAAKLVVSATGTAAWDALKVGVPALTLGHTFHSLCEFSPKITDSKKLMNYIDSIKTASREAVLESVELFIKDYHKIFVETAHIDHALGDFNRELAIKNLCYALSASLEKKYQLIHLG